MMVALKYLKKKIDVAVISNQGYLQVYFIYFFY